MVELIFPLLEGLRTGMILSLLIGPVFFALIQTSLERGFIKGLQFATGIVLSDAIYFLVLYFTLSQFHLEEDGPIMLYMGTIGGAVLCGFGLSLIIKKPKPRVDEAKLSHGKRATHPILKAFLLNALNPFVLLFWLALVSNLTVEYSLHPQNAFLFFIGAMSVIFIGDVGKAYLAQKLQNFITPKRMLWFNRIAGAALLYGGVKVILKFVI